MAITDATGTKWAYTARWKYVNGTKWKVTVILTTKTGTVLTGDTLSVRHSTNGRNRTYTDAYIGEKCLGGSYNATLNLSDFPASALLNGEYQGGTFKITGGEDAANSEFLEWLQAIATKIPVISFKHRYRNTTLIGTGTYKFRPYTVDEPTVTLISFTIDGTTYQAEEGMTWAEWVESSYNTGGFHTVGNNVTYDGSRMVSTSETERPEYWVLLTDEIIDDKNYYLVLYGGGN